MKIRFIVHTVSSESDVYGNRHHYAVITSTKTGKGLTCVVGGESNARALVYDACGDNWAGIYSVESSVPKRVWKNRRDAQRENRSIYEHEVTTKMIQSLERK